MNKKHINAPENDSRYHDTLLLKKYRDVVWNLELSVQQARRQFQAEYGSSIEDFLKAVSLGGADLSGSDIERHAKNIERSNKMLKLVDSAVDLIRDKHKDGEALYWTLYYAYLSPQQLDTPAEITEQLRLHLQDVSVATYYRKRKNAVNVLSDVLWGYSSRECAAVLELLFPES
jgi:hypothetical protein